MSTKLYEVKKHILLTSQNKHEKISSIKNTYLWDFLIKYCIILQ